MSIVLDKLREATKGTEYEGRLFLVGGIVRDRVLGLPDDEDVDIVLEDDATKLAHFISKKGLADHAPVVYPRFGTAMVSVLGRQVELVSARSESYSPESRKPDVVLATLDQDVLRRDFTINTLLQNLHTGEILDLTGRAMRDIREGIIRTPTDPDITFEDDPLRMLRAVRFAARFGFEIEHDTYEAIGRKAARLQIISAERIRDEFSKMLMTSARSQAIEILRTTGLLAEFAPELLTMHGVTQNIYHIYDVWTHTMKALEAIPEDSDLTLRLAALFHDVGKPRTRSVDEHGNVHFYTHQVIGSDISRRVLSRLRYPNEMISRVAKIISMHLRVGEYDSEWTDTAVRRLVRDAGSDLETLIALTNADKSAANTAIASVDIDELRERIAHATAKIDVASIRSPLDGNEIMRILGIDGGPVLGEIKEFLANEVIEGRLAQDDKETAADLVREGEWGVES